jgi:nucleotide-binding universal stress UspA family protein
VSLPDLDRVLVATDGSESVGRAVDVALDLAARFGARVETLYVLDEAELNGSPDQVRDDLRNALQQTGGEALVEARRRAETRGVDVTTAVREGRPADEILAHARETDADLVATGTRGRHGEHRLLVGSVAERVVRHCPVPVLTVRRLDP